MADQNQMDSVAQKLIEKLMQEKQKELQTMLHNQLNDTPWKKNISNMCRGLIMQQGLDRVDLDEVVDKVLPAAINAVPDHIKQEMVFKIKRTLEGELIDQQQQQQ